MKKSKFFVFGLCSVLLLAGSLAGCANAADGGSPGTPSQTTTPADATTGTTTTTTTTTSGTEVSDQAGINAAAAGTTVSLASSMAGQSISIDKALTVNGNNVSNVTVTVAPNVRNNVTLRNLNHATIRVASTNNTNASINTINSSTINSSVRSIAGRIFRADNTSSAGGTNSTNAFKNLDEGAVPIKLEGCTDAKVESEKDIALYLGSGENKSTIEEIKLKEGVQDFSFIEMDDKNTATTAKSKVEKLSIEDDGVQKINLIGGTFDDVNLKNGFNGSIDFNYDKEFSDQLGSFSGKGAFFADTKIKEKDVAVADDKAANATSTSTTDHIYQFTMSRELFNTLNGHFSIIFLTADQAANACDFSSEHTELLSFATPAYDMSLMGAFTVETASDNSITNEYHAVYGASTVFFDYANSIKFDDGIGYRSIKTTTLDKYMTYSKDAVIVSVGASEVSVIVNKSAIRKSDLLLCSGYRWNNQGNDATGSSEGGTKLSNINLDGYTPYFCINEFGFNGARSAMSTLRQAGKSLKGQMPANGDENSIPPVYIPSSDKSAFPGFYFPFEMEIYNGSYPDVSAVQYPDITIPGERVKVRYYNSSLTFTNERTNVIRNNLDPLTDNWEYFLDESFSNMVCGNNWDSVYTKNNIAAGSAVTIYARPKRNITFSWPEWNTNEGPIPVTRLAEIEFGNPILVGMFPVKIFKNYDSSTNTYSNPITRPDDTYLVDGNTIYITYYTVNVKSVGTNSGTSPVLLSKMRVNVLKDLLENSNQVNIYTTAACNENSKYTYQNIYNVEQGADVFVKTPSVKVDPTFDTGTNQVTYAHTYAFADFYALIQQEGQTFYLRVNQNGQDSFPQCTKDAIDEKLARNEIVILTDLEVYTSIPNQQ